MNRSLARADKLSVTWRFPESLTGHLIPAWDVRPARLKLLQQSHGIWFLGEVPNPESGRLSLGENRRVVA